MLSLAHEARGLPWPKPGGIMGENHGIFKKANYYREFTKKWEENHASEDSED